VQLGMPAIRPQELTYPDARVERVRRAFAAGACFSTPATIAASKPMPAVKANQRSSRRPRLIGRRRPWRSPSSSAPVASIGLLGSPIARANTLVDPAGTTPSAGTLSWTPSVSSRWRPRSRAVAAERHDDVDLVPHRPQASAAACPDSRSARSAGRRNCPGHGPGRRAAARTSRSPAGSRQRAHACSGAYLERSFADPFDCWTGLRTIPLSGAFAVEWWLQRTTRAITHH